MKNWVTFVLVALGGYWMYSSWFASEDTAPESNTVTEQLGAEDKEAAVTDDTDSESGDQPLRLDLSGGEGPAVPEGSAKPAPGDALHQARKKALAEKRTGDAQKLTLRILAEFPDSDAARWVHFERGRAALHAFRSGKWKKDGWKKAQEARQELTHALFLSNVDAAEKETLRQTLSELADAVLFSSRHIEGVDKMYTPKRGSNLETLCRKVFPRFGAYPHPGLIVEVNGLKSPNHMRAGEPLKVPLGRPHIVVVKSEFRLYFLLGGAYVCDFPIGLGREDSTPETAFEIKLKQPNPDWYPSVGKRVPYGDPRNILGTRWMGFKNTAAHSGFGIHGTPDPDSIGKEESSGCVRMLRADVERLYGWTPVGTRVDIRP